LTEGELALVQTVNCNRGFALFWAICLLGTNSGWGATILTSPAEFTQPTLYIGFESFPNGNPVPYNTLLKDQWNSDGVSLGDGSASDATLAFDGVSGGSLFVPPHQGTRAISDSEPSIRGGFIEFRFVVPLSMNPGTVTEAGLWVQNADMPSIVSFFDANNNLIQDIATTSDDFFAGLHADQGIAVIRVTDPDNYIADALQFTPVPEASALTLAICGLFASVGRVLKRRHD
jgi:hypothetical protein